MYYPNYNPFYMQNRNYMYKRNFPNTIPNFEKIDYEKKDIEESSNDTISFQDFYQNNNPPKDTESNKIPIENTNNETFSNIQKNKNRFFSFDKNQINILGFSLEIDDLIIIGLILLLLLESDKNYSLIIILGLILLNINLGDIINLF